ncbi:MAG: DUF5615 family PIN-like protein [Steroidobacteraceae bacterium]
MPPTSRPKSLSTRCRLPDRPCDFSWTRTCRARRSRPSRNLVIRSNSRANAGLGTAPDEVIAERARSTQAALITRDLDFADVRRYPPSDYHGIMILRLPDDAVAAILPPS